MKPEQLGAHPNGSLLTVADSMGQAWAFLPADLPPTIESDWEVTQAVERAGSALASLVAVAGLVQNVGLIMRPFRQREAAFSSRIEGTQTLVQELLEAEAIPDLERNEDSDRFEVMNYLRALDTGLEKLTIGHPINATLIRGLHAELMRGVRGQDKRPGRFRPGLVSIGGTRLSIAGARYVPPPPEHVSQLIDNLLAFYASGSQYGTLIDAAIMHYQFEAIHPFEDGNGRTGRLLIPLILHARGTLSRPILYLSPYFERYVDDYRDLLLRVSTHGDWRAWILFFLDAVRDQAEESKLRAERVLSLQAEYRKRTDRLGRAQAAALRAIDVIMEEVYVSAPDLAKRLNIAYPTARFALDGLTELGIVAPSTRFTRPQVWVAEELIQAVYAE